MDPSDTIFFKVNNKRDAAFRFSVGNLALGMTPFEDADQTINLDVPHEIKVASCLGC